MSNIEELCQQNMFRSIHNWMYENPHLPHLPSFSTQEKALSQSYDFQFLSCSLTYLSLLEFLCCPFPIVCWTFDSLLLTTDLSLHSTWACPKGNVRVFYSSFIIIRILGILPFKDYFSSLLCFLWGIVRQIHFLSFSI